MGEQTAALKQKEREVGKLQKECAAQRQAVKEMGNALKSAESTAQHARSAFCTCHALGLGLTAFVQPLIKVSVMPTMWFGRGVIWR